MHILDSFSANYSQYKSCMGTLIFLTQLWDSSIHKMIILCTSFDTSDSRSIVLGYLQKALAEVEQPHVALPEAWVAPRHAVFL